MDYKYRKPGGVFRRLAWVVLLLPLFSAGGCGGGGGDDADIGARRIALLSLGWGGSPANGASVTPVVSGDGRFVAFASRADNLTAEDTNQTQDIFIYEIASGKMERLAATADGMPPNGPSAFPRLSRDGRYVVFASNAGNWTSDQSSGYWEVFIYDRGLSQVEKISVAGDGGTANGDSYPGEVSADGRYVAFMSEADNLTSEDRNFVMDVFIRDRATQTTQRISRSPEGLESEDYSWGVSLTPDGRYAAFASYAGNLLPDGNNRMEDVFIADWATLALQLASFNGGGEGGNNDSYMEVGGLSADGRQAIFESLASDLTADDNNEVADIFVFDASNSSVARVSVSSSGEEGNGASREGRISANGRYVVFSSVADNLDLNDANGASDVFFRDLISGKTTRISISLNGTDSNGAAEAPSISADGRVIAFSSRSDNLIPGDINGVADIFLIQW